MPRVSFDQVVHLADCQPVGITWRDAHSAELGPLAEMHPGRVDVFAAKDFRGKRICFGGTTLNRS